MAQLWTNTRTPQTDDEMTLAVGTWLQFFSNVPFAVVSRAINEIAAEGGEFAPQIGQIYARVKAGKTERLKATSEIENAYRNHARVLAKLLEIEPPNGTVENIKNWFAEVKHA